jgi:site-specific DNA-methyltransferase (adenine-specific)
VSDWQVIEGDCLEVMPLLPDGSLDAVICDLPYGTTQNRWDSVIPLGPLWEQYKRLLKAAGVVVLTASQPFTSALVMSNPKWFRHEWIWKKPYGGNFANTVREPFKEHESVVVFSAGRWTYNKQMEPRTASGQSRAKYKRVRTTMSPNYGSFKATPQYTDDDYLRQSNTSFVSVACTLRRSP